MKYRVFILLLFSVRMLSAQVLTWSPLFPTRNDTITVTYDAAQGNGGLVGASEVYTHLGVITNLSSNGADWRYVKTNWCQNTPETKLTSLGNDLWQMTFHIESYFGVPAAETIEQIAFVFRNASGSRTGRAADGSDLYLPVFPEGLQVTILTPIDTSPFAELGDSLLIQAAGQNTVRMTLEVDGLRVLDVAADSLSHTLIAETAGRKEITVTAFDTSGAAAATSFDWVVNPAITISLLPLHVKDGINITGADEVTLSLFAPNKQFVYVVGSFNGWKCDLDGFMKRSPDGRRWWLTISGLNPDSLYSFQYYVDGDLKIADPYTTLVLDPWNDASIPESIFPDLPDYPVGKTNQIVGTFRTAPDSFTWTDQEYQRPQKEDLIIYELLLRDFLADHDYKMLLDTLDYLQNLGVNTIELMPVNEFEGNESWGYNSSFYFAVDKYYGSAADFKRLVNEAHSRGMAVLIDMVLNHAYGQCPLVRLYWDGENNRPASDNPWFNQESPNPVYSWGYDFNHEKFETQAFVDRVLTYWVTEFHIDGYRLDFVKGFTNTAGDGGGYDPHRVGLVKRIADQLWSVDPDLHIILELFADNQEETVYAEYRYGLMMWGNMNSAYGQSAMGWLSDSGHSSDLYRAYYKSRGWTKPGLVTYMESHDEPWLTWKMEQYGRSQGNYDIKQVSTALERYALATAFFLTIPGPKMMWQFGELGYAEELPSSGYSRTAPKPVRWDYFQDQERRRLYDTIAAINRLRQKHALFRSADTDLTMHTGHGTYGRWLHLSVDSMKATVVGNFDVKPLAVIPGFQYAGTWYDYFSGESIVVQNVDTALTIQPGEFRIFLDRPEDKPLLTGVPDESHESSTEQIGFVLYPNYPNPFNNRTVISFTIEKQEQVDLTVHNIRGQRVACLIGQELHPGVHRVEWDAVNENGISLPSGVYFIHLQAGGLYKTEKMMLIK